MAIVCCSLLYPIYKLQLTLVVPSSEINNTLGPLTSIHGYNYV